MQTTQCESQSELLFQSVGLSNGWITTQLQRHSVMLLYGLFVLQFGHADPQPPLSLDDVQHRVRLLFDRGIAAWPKQLSDLLNSLWAQDLDQEATLAHYAEEIASTARHVGKCLLGQYPLVSELLG